MDKYKGHKDCYCCSDCSYDCPNANAQAYCDKYDIDFSDIGYERIKCGKCYKHDYECNSCYFYNSERCPEYKVPTIVKASDIKPDDEWMQEDEWDEIYKQEENLPDINVGNIKESEE